MVLDELAARAGIRLSPGKGARCPGPPGEGRLAGRRVVLARPLTYMNESGGPVRGLLDYHYLPARTSSSSTTSSTSPSHRPPQAGRGRRRAQRAAIDLPLHRHADYLRVRVGIGRPPGRQDPADFVLKDFSAASARSSTC